MGHIWEFHEIDKIITEIDMTAAEGIDFGFSVIWNSPLKATITGAIRRYLRPTNSDKEDIVINALNLDFDQLQGGVLNINLFVPNPEYSIIIDGKPSRMRDIPNDARIKTLCGSLNSVLKEVYDKQKFILLELVNQQILPENEQTIINNRVKLTIKNL